MLSNLDNQDYTAFWPASPSLPIMWDAGYSQYTVSLLSQDDFLPRSYREVEKVETLRARHRTLRWDYI